MPSAWCSDWHVAMTIARPTPAQSSCKWRKCTPSVLCVPLFSALISCLARLGRQVSPESPCRQEALHWPHVRIGLGCTAERRARHQRHLLPAISLAQRCLPACLLACVCATGLEMVRRDQCPATVKAQERVLRTVGVIADQPSPATRNVINSYFEHAMSAPSGFRHQT